MHVGERICALQKREKVRQNVLARMVGITPGALTNFEKGRRQVSLDWLERIADALDTPVAYFQGEGRGGSVQHHFRLACRKAGIEELGIHDLRHTFASRLVASGADLVTAKDLLGHAVIETTLRYAHSQAHQEAINRLDALYPGVQSAQDAAGSDSGAIDVAHKTWKERKQLGATKQPHALNRDLVAPVNLVPEKGVEPLQS